MDFRRRERKNGVHFSNVMCAAIPAVSTHGCKSIASMSGFRSDSRKHC
jgi:hypothetical protein